MELLGSILAVLVGLAAGAASQVATAAPASESHSDDGAGAYKTHLYHNLFVERLGHTSAETHAKVDQAFQHLFHGDGQ